MHRPRTRGTRLLAVEQRRAKKVHTVAARPRVELFDKNFFLARKKQHEKLQCGSRESENTARAGKKREHDAPSGASAEDTHMLKNGFPIFFLQARFPEKKTCQHNRTTKFHGSRKVFVPPPRGTVHICGFSHGAPLLLFCRFPFFSRQLFRRDSFFIFVFLAPFMICVLWFRTLLCLYLCGLSTSTRGVHLGSTTTDSNTT